MNLAKKSDNPALLSHGNAFFFSGIRFFLETFSQVDKPLTSSRVNSVIRVKKKTMTSKHTPTQCTSVFARLTCCVDP